MRCPSCGSMNTVVIDSRINVEQIRRRRRYRCNRCDRNFSTMEIYRDVFIETQTNIDKLEQIQNILHQEGEV